MIRLPKDSKNTGWLQSRVRALWRPLIAALLFVAASAVSAQEVVLFALRGDGTASVAVDKEAKRAWITDGGRSGEQGVREARIAEQDLFAYLASIGIKDIAIICSHPHSDHMGGLEDLVADSRILGFATVQFVDSGIPAPRSLYGRFQAKWGKQGNGPKVSYTSAEGAEAFGRSAMSGGNVSVNNFVYDSATVGKTEHDKSVIMQYNIKGKPPQTVVDFDDASTALVERWSKHPGSKATVVVHPHHGSRNNSIDVLIKKRDAIGLKDVVITVNRRNRYMHPAPEVLLTLIETLGPEHVFITDSEIGENVRITNAGVTDGRSAGDHIARLRAFAVAQHDRYEAKARQALQVGDADSAILTTARWNAAMDQPPGKRKKADIEPKLRNLFEAIMAYERIVAILDSAREGKAWNAGMFRPGRRPPPEEPAGTRPEDPPSGPGGGSGEFFRKEQEAKSEQGFGGTGGSRFDAEISRALPRFGGIVIGNEVSGPLVEKVEFLDPEAGMTGAARQAVIRVTVKGNGTVDYVDVTNAELWAAHSFVQPSASLLGRYKQQDFRSPGVVGLSTNTDGVSKVSLHPALAGTALGWSAMYADNVMGHAKKQSEVAKSEALPPSFRSFPWAEFRYDALQWFDGRSTVVINSPAVTLKSADAKECLLNMRVSFRPADSEVTSYFQETLAKMIVRALKNDYPSLTVDRAYRKFQAAVERAEPLKSSTEQRLIAAQVTISELKKDRESAELFYKQAVSDMKKEKLNESSLWKSNPWPTDQTQSICMAYPPLRAMNRFAKLVAVLNWAQRSSGKALPGLPDWVQPIWRSTPDKIEIKQDPFFALIK